MTPIVDFGDGTFGFDITLDFTAGVFLSAVVQPLDGRVRLVLEAPAAPAGGTVVIGRVHPSGRAAVVRQANGVVLFGSGIYFDYEIPIRTTCAYQAQIYNTDGTLWGVSNVAAATWDTDDDWLKDPGLPTRNMRITVAEMAEYDYETPTGVFTVQGRPSPIVVTDVRQAATGNLVLYTTSDNERDQLHLLTSTGNVLLMQTPPERGVRNMYLALQKVQESRVMRLGVEVWRQWTLQYQEVESPAGPGLSGGPTYQDVVDGYSTYAAVVAGEVDYLDLAEGVNVLVAPPPETIVWRGA